MQNGSSVGICTRCVHVFVRLATICMLSRWLSKKNSASELRWKFTKSALLVGWLPLGLKTDKKKRSAKERHFQTSDASKCTKLEQGKKSSFFFCHEAKKKKTSTSSSTFAANWRRRQPEGIGARSSSSSSSSPPPCWLAPMPLSLPFTGCTNPACGGGHEIRRMGTKQIKKRREREKKLPVLKEKNDTTPRFAYSSLCLLRGLEMLLLFLLLFLLRKVFEQQ